MRACDSDGRRTESLRGRTISVLKSMLLNVCCLNVQGRIGGEGGESGGEGRIDFVGIR